MASMGGRLFELLELNVVSIKNARPKDLAVFELQPHYVTRRYAEFVAAVLHTAVYVELLGDTKFVASVRKALVEMRVFSVILGSSAFEPPPTPKIRNGGLTGLPLHLCV